MYDKGFAWCYKLKCFVTIQRILVCNTKEILCNTKKILRNLRTIALYYACSKSFVIQKDFLCEDLTTLKRLPQIALRQRCTVRNSFVKNRRPSESFLPSAVVNFQKLWLSNSINCYNTAFNQFFFPLLMHVVNFQQKSGISKCFLTVCQMICIAKPSSLSP